jgi:hypothetical protein
MDENMLNERNQIKKKTSYCHEVPEEASLNRHKVD